MDHLPSTASLREYERQARELADGLAAGTPDALRVFRDNHPRFLSSDIPWLPLPVSDHEVRATVLHLEDARLTLARWYSFRDWLALAEIANAMEGRRRGVYEFEVAADAVIDGDRVGLEALIREHPELMRARSSRITKNDPAVHRATLLHYVAANGVEDHRQRTPANAVEIAKTLLDAGADPNATAGMYGDQCTTLSMLVSSAPPARAGLQSALVETLLDYGADPEGAVMTALAFGYVEAAQTLVRRGARTDRLALAAGLGRIAEARELLEAAGAEERHRALALAAQLGHVEVVRMLLDAGEDPDRYNPAGLHAHATPLHHAALGGHAAVVRLLVERGARTDLRDKIWDATPKGWAEHGGHGDIAESLP